jgi:three-Cys-motif partner protein
MEPLRIDEVGYWSEIKLDILKEYAAAYSTVLAAQTGLRGHVYIDAFAGAGVHLSKTTGQYIPGSPLNALLVQPPFQEYHFIDLDGGRAAHLRELAVGFAGVSVHEGDCNQVLLDTVFPRVRYGDYRRGLCLLDPYALNLKWQVIEAAGRERSIEIFLNFMVMDMNMNVLKRDRTKVRPDQEERMTGFWGDESWRDVAYQKEAGLFGDYESKSTNDALAEGFRKRLKEMAGFAFVPEPVPMRNTTGSVVYYLFFASPNKTGNKIVTDIFSKYRNRGAS